MTRGGSQRATAPEGAVVACETQWETGPAKSLNGQTAHGGTGFPRTEAVRERALGWHFSGLRQRRSAEIISSVGFTVHLVYTHRYEGSPDSPLVPTSVWALLHVVPRRSADRRVISTIGQRCFGVDASNELCPRFVGPVCVCHLRFPLSVVNRTTPLSHTGQPRSSPSGDTET